MAQPDLVALGRAVRELRDEKELSQEALGYLADIHRTYVGGVERGERNVTYLMLLRLARALGVDAAELVGRAQAADR
jgi:transcriptional regulator with XRE-family HTH domain